MAKHSSILVRKIPGTEDPLGLQSMGLQRVGHDLATEQQQQILGQVLKLQRAIHSVVLALLGLII